MNPTIDSTIAERGKIYGDPSLSHHNIGLSWTGILQQHYGLKLDHPIPDFLVELMMVAFKTHRAARVYHADNYIDLAAYAKFAENDQKPKPEIASRIAFPGAPPSPPITQDTTAKEPTCTAPEPVTWSGQPPLHLIKKPYRLKADGSLCMCIDCRLTRDLNQFLK